MRHRSALALRPAPDVLEGAPYADWRVNSHGVVTEVEGDGVAALGLGSSVIGKHSMKLAGTEQFREVLEGLLAGSAWEGWLHIFGRDVYLQSRPTYLGSYVVGAEGRTYIVERQGWTPQLLEPEGEAGEAVLACVLEHSLRGQGYHFESGDVLLFQGARLCCERVYDERVALRVRERVSHLLQPVAALDSPSPSAPREDARQAPGSAPHRPDGAAFHPPRPRLLR